MATVRCTDPSSPRTTTLCGPVARPSIVSGATPRSFPSIDTRAPVGLDSICKRPIPVVATAAADAAGAGFVAMPRGEAGLAGGLAGALTGSRGASACDEGFGFVPGHAKRTTTPSSTTAAAAVRYFQEDRASAVVV